MFSTILTSCLSKPGIIFDIIFAHHVNKLTSSIGYMNSPKSLNVKNEKYEQLLEIGLPLNT